ncbi:MAG: T9SS type A sorting domain-containing protein [Ignavibacteriae bacterium]|nr:T9SS type A sorting domain-containing protein [Ignavibacteriota bacterium]
MYLKLSIEGLSSSVYKATVANFEEIDRNVAIAIPKETISQVGSTANSIPAVFALHPNYPNPFNPSTQINFDLPEASHVTLAVYDVLGRKVAELVNGQVAEGYHTATWNASDVASGVYFARFTATDANGVTQLSKVVKLLLAK